MTGSKDLQYLLREANPVLDNTEYVFVTQEGSYGDFAEWQPLGTFVEEEGMTFVLTKRSADAHLLRYDGVFRRITLQVHSSLEAVGLTARFSQCLADADVSANVFAAYYHDHIFVPAADARKAMTALRQLADQ
ncbi:MAG: ACT domain-containing protein [Pseudomonadota bacterium]